MAACLVLAAWLAGRLATDRTILTQYVFWVPTPVPLAAAAALAAASWLMALGARARGTGRRPGRWARRAAAAGLAVATAYMLVVEWRVHALVARPPAGSGFRIFYWNAPMWPRVVADAVLAQDAELVMIANPVWTLPRQRLSERMGAVSEVRTSRFLVLSRHPVLRWGEIALGLEDLEQVPGEAWELMKLPEGTTDEGRAMFFVLDAGETLGGPIVVWLIDLPSDLRLSRWEVLKAAAEKIATWEGPAHADGEIIEGGAARGFPEPDLVVGDFNTPRGSASLRFLTGGMANAYDQGGAGYAATFPRERPLWHIDLMFVAPRLRALRYDVVDPGEGRHRMQVAELAPAAGAVRTGSK